MKQLIPELPLLVSFLFYIFAFSQTTTPATISINDSPDFPSLRICAQRCVNHVGYNDDLEGFRDCGNTVVLDSCFCRTDLRGEATSFFSSCIIKKCGYVEADFTDALEVYDKYCRFTNDAAQTPLSTPATTGAGTPITSSPVINGGGLSAGATAGIGIGCAMAGIFISISVGLWWRSRRKRNQLNAAANPALSPTQLPPPQAGPSRGGNYAYSEVGAKPAEASAACSPQPPQELSSYGNTPPVEMYAGYRR